MLTRQITSYIAEICKYTGPSALQMVSTFVRSSHYIGSNEEKQESNREAERTWYLSAQQIKQRSARFDNISRITLALCHLGSFW